MLNGRTHLFSSPLTSLRFPFNLSSVLFTKDNHNSITDHLARKGFERFFRILNILYKSHVENFACLTWVTARAELPIPTGVCREIFGCPNNGMSASVWDFFMCILAHAITHGACTCRHVKRVCIGSWRGEKNPMPHRGLEPASGLAIPLTEWSDCYVYVHPQVAARKSPAQRARSGGQLWREHLSLHWLPLHPGFHEIFCCQHQHLWRRGHRHWGMLNCCPCSGVCVELAKVV